MTLSALAVLVAVAALGLLASRAGDSTTGSGDRAATVGPLDQCRTHPRFVRQLGLGETAGFTTGWTGTVGLAIVEPGGTQGSPKVYQDPSWSEAGHLGPHVTDRFGNLYVAPFPRDPGQLNPPAEQNRVYRVDTDTQELSLLLELEPGGTPSDLSPMGVVGLAYDCETDSLYATSLAGSTATREVGRIFRIDLQRGRVADVYDKLDAAGVAAFRTRAGRRLYLGSARQPKLLSLALDQHGDFIGRPRLEIDLAKDAPAGRTTAYQIRFPEPRTMELALADFRGLSAASVAGDTIVRYAYDDVADRWRR